MLKMKARYTHDCAGCTFLGQYEEYDLYSCPQGGLPTVIARYGHDGPQYHSGMDVPHPALIEAKKRRGRVFTSTPHKAENPFYKAFQDSKPKPRPEDRPGEELSGQVDP